MHVRVPARKGSRTERDNERKSHTYYVTDVYSPAGDSANQQTMNLLRP